MNIYPETPHEAMKRDHGWFSFGGLIAVIFCFMAIIWPQTHIWMLAIVCVVFALSDSIFSMLLALRIRRKGQCCWPHFIISVAGLMAGMAVLALPEINPMMLVYIVAVWVSVITGGHIASNLLTGLNG